MAGRERGVPEARAVSQETTDPAQRPGGCGLGPQGCGSRGHPPVSPCPVRSRRCQLGVGHGPRASAAVAGAQEDGGRSPGSGRGYREGAAAEKERGISDRVCLQRADEMQVTRGSGLGEEVGGGWFTGVERSRVACLK